MLQRADGGVYSEMNIKHTNTVGAKSKILEYGTYWCNT
jgi:hypothetical protein